MSRKKKKIKTIDDFQHKALPTLEDLIEEWKEKIDLLLKASRVKEAHEGQKLLKRLEAHQNDRKRPRA